MTEIRFDDGASYERTMGVWSRLAGEVFLDWLALPGELRWLDVGCGNGAFTELLGERAVPASLDGIDPSSAQLAFARSRPVATRARFVEGSALDLPYPDDSFDATAMALVIFFVPDPAKSVAQMRRVTRPGGTIAAYAWDMAGGGFPFAPIARELKAAGRTPPMPPSVEASRLDVLEQLWTDAGLHDVQSRQISVERTFADFDECWAVSSRNTGTAALLATMTEGEIARVREGLRGRLVADANGRITTGARANAVKGRVAPR